MQEICVGPLPCGGSAYVVCETESSPLDGARVAEASTGGMSVHITGIGVIDYGCH